MTGDRKNLPASIAGRLRNQAKATERPYDELLTYYAIERFLYRLASTSNRVRFVLKGALMLPLWGSSVTRATRDIDLLGRGAPTPAEVAAMIRDCIAAAVPSDGIVFDPTTIRVNAIREHERYVGIRATFVARLERSRISMQVDIGLGDAITPGVVEISYPTLLDLPGPKLIGYPVETTIAEKLEALVNLGLANSRMKDFFDLWNLLGNLELDGDTLVAAVRATFARRDTPIPAIPPVGVTDAFANDRAKRDQWAGFAGRLKRIAPPTLPEVVARLARFAPAVFDGSAARRRWIPDSGWVRGKGPVSARS